MPAVSRKGDELTTGHICATTTTLDTPGQGTCFANSILIARKTDSTVSHPFPPAPPCVPHSTNLSAASTTVFVNSLGISRIGDSYSCGVKLNAGSPNVFVEGLAVARIGDSADAGAMTSGSGNVFSNG